jgi:hypothetical protein
MELEKGNVRAEKRARRGSCPTARKGHAQRVHRGKRARKITRNSPEFKKG